MADDRVDQGQPWQGHAEQAYANIVMLASGPFDVQLVFGHQDNASRKADSTNVETTEVVRVAMSWGHLKSMVPLLAKIVAQYEEQFGEIPAPGFDTLWKE